MSTLKELLDRLRRGPSDVVGLDLGSTAVKAVRMRRAGNETSIVAADILPPVPPPEAPSDDSAEVALPEPFALPTKLKAPYASLAVSGENAVVKLLSMPGHFDARAEGKVIESMGLKNPEDFRIGYKLVSEGHGKTESKVLAVALPEIAATHAVALLPAGRPAPFSVELSGLAAMAAFLHGTGQQHTEDAVGVVDFGAKTSSFSICNQGVLALYRKFDFGGDVVLQKIQETLGVDQETAQGILTDGSFDVSQSVNDVMAPRIKQLILSRDFVERRESCHVSRLYVSGGLTSSEDILKDIGSAMEIEAAPWAPLDGLTVARDGLSEELAGQEWRLAGAVGACLATLEQE